MDEVNIKETPERAEAPGWTDEERAQYWREREAEKERQRIQSIANWRRVDPASQDLVLHRLAEDANKTREAARPIQEHYALRRRMAGNAHACDVAIDMLRRNRGEAPLVIEINTTATDEEAHACLQRTLEIYRSMP